MGCGPGGAPPRRLSGFVLVLWSRRLRAGDCPVSPTMEPCLACPQPAGAVWGGIPPHVLGETLPSAGLQRAWGAAPGCNPPARACAHHRGLPRAPCQVGQGTAPGRGANAGGSVTQPVRAGLARPACRALPPAARPGLAPVAQERGPGATPATPRTVWPQERPALRPVPRHPLARAPVAHGRAARPCRLRLDTPRDAGPAHDAGPARTRTPSPARRCLSHAARRLAPQARRDPRCHDVAAPAHPHARLAPRHKARAPQRCLRWLALAPRAAASSRTLAARRRTPPPHVRTRGAWRALDAPASVARALDAAVLAAAVSSASSATLGAQRARFPPEARA